MFAWLGFMNNFNAMLVPFAELEQWSEKFLSRLSQNNLALIQHKNLFLPSYEIFEFANANNLNWIYAILCCVHEISHLFI